MNIAVIQYDWSHICSYMSVPQRRFCFARGTGEPAPDDPLTQCGRWLCCPGTAGRVHGGSGGNTADMAQPGLELPLVVIIVVIVAMVLVSNWLSHITIRIHEPDWAGNRAPAPTT